MDHYRQNIMQSLKTEFIHLDLSNLSREIALLFKYSHKIRTKFYLGKWKRLKVLSVEQIIIKLTLHFLEYPFFTRSQIQRNS